MCVSVRKILIKVRCLFFCFLLLLCQSSFSFSFSFSYSFYTFVFVYSLQLVSTQLDNTSWLSRFVVLSSIRFVLSRFVSFKMSFQGPKLEPTSSSAAAASSEPITRSNSSPQISLHQSTEPTSQSSEPHISLSQMRNLITSMFQEFQTITLPQQIATAVQNAMHNSQGQSQSSPFYCNSYYIKPYS